jgi:hypothetical protein
MSRYRCAACAHVVTADSRPETCPVCHESGPTLLESVPDADHDSCLRYESVRCGGCPFGKATP